MRKIVTERGQTVEVSILPESQVKEILNNIQRIRKDKNIKIKEIAAKMDISDNQYSNLENGRSKITVLQLFFIIDILSCSLNEVFNFGEEISDEVKAELQRLAIEIQSKQNYIRLLENENQALKQ